MLRDGKICFFLNMAALLIAIDKWVESNHHCFSHNTNWLFKGFALAAITPNYSHHLESVRGSVFNPSDCKQDVWESYEWINMRLCGECGCEGRNMRPVIPVGLMWVWVHTEKSKSKQQIHGETCFVVLSFSRRETTFWKASVGRLNVKSPWNWNGVFCFTLWSFRENCSRQTKVQW